MYLNYDYKTTGKYWIFTKHMKTIIHPIVTPKNRCQHSIMWGKIAIIRKEMKNTANTNEFFVTKLSAF